jgi:hypothetical protein
MRVWTKPELIVDELALSQHYANGCGDVDYIIITCEANQNKFHRGNINPYTLTVDVANLTSQQHIYYDEKDWHALLLNLEPGLHTKGTHSVTGTTKTRNIPQNS